MTKAFATSLVIHALIRFTVSDYHDACSDIAKRYHKSKLGQGENLVRIQGQLAYECLRSMPFRADLALQFIDDYFTYIQFHSTVDDLKAPPEGYMSSAVDLSGGFADIRQKAAAGVYSSQFDFDWDLTKLLSSANDGHLRSSLCSQEIFHFEHSVPLVSISEDGIQLPQLYTYDDAKSKVEGSSPISPIIQINGVDAIYFLEAHVAKNLDFQDPDARFNRLFPSVTANFTGGYAGGAWTTFRGLWPGVAGYTLRFGNGTEYHVEVTASWPSSNGPMVYQNGEMLYQAACLSNSGSMFGAYPGSFSARPLDHFLSSGSSAYPTSVMQYHDGLISGYYIDDSRFCDVAVLQVPTFGVGDLAAEYSEIAITFLKDAVSAGKTKLVVDLSGNSGGDVIPGFNLFKALFPDRPIYSATRFRSTELVYFMGAIYSQMLDMETVLDPPLVATKAVPSSIRQQGGFKDWKDLFGPHQILHSNMSSLYAHFNFNIASTTSDPISGFGPVPLNPTTRLFGQENIIIVSDGQCASTCALLSDLLRKEGVRSVVFGGRPRYGPMQSVGGVKGGQLWTLSAIHRYISRAHSIAAQANEGSKPLLTHEQLARFKKLAPPHPSNFSLQSDRYHASSVNFRNAYAEGNDITPLQFIYQASNCRLFLTIENYLYPETRWIAAAHAMFRGGSCVRDSTQGYHS